MHIVKRCVKLVIDLLTMLVFLLLAIVIFAEAKNMISSSSYFELFGYSVFNVATGSMEPTIKQNDVVLVKKQGKYNVDDIITFYDKKDFITHRIIYKKGDVVITKGDANNTKDVSIKTDVIVGKVVKIFSNGGVWLKVVKTPSIMIMIFVTLILFDFAFSFKGFKKKDDNKEVVKKEKKSLFKKKEKEVKEVEEIKEEVKVEEPVIEEKKDEWDSYFKFGNPEIKNKKDESKEEEKENKEEFIDDKWDSYFKYGNPDIDKVKEKEKEKWDGYFKDGNPEEEWYNFYTDLDSDDDDVFDEEKKKKSKSKDEFEDTGVFKFNDNGELEEEKKEVKKTKKEPKKEEEKVIDLNDEEDNLGYTVRLDLNELQKQINAIMNGESDGK